PPRRRRLGAIGGGGAAARRGAGRPAPRAGPRCRRGPRIRAHRRTGAPRPDATAGRRAHTDTPRLLRRPDVSTGGSRLGPPRGHGQVSGAIWPAPDGGSPALGGSRAG